MPVRLETARLLVTMLEPSDAGRLLDFYRRNREHLEPWEPPRSPGFYTKAFWSDRLRQDQAEYATGQSLRLSLVEPKGGEVVGTCNYTNIVRGAFHGCYLGYSLDHGVQGRGLMREALEASIEYVFDVMGLHRIMANYQPTNERSGRVLRRLGFVVEGYARDYLYIAGGWRDHVLTALTNPRAVVPII